MVEKYAHSVDTSIEDSFPPQSLVIQLETLSLEKIGADHSLGDLVALLRMVSEQESIPFARLSGRLKRIAANGQ